MTNRSMTAKSLATVRRWGLAAIASRAVMAALPALTAEAAPKQSRPAPVKEEMAPRPAGEPIMAIVSIKSQQINLVHQEYEWMNLMENTA